MKEIVEEKLKQVQALTSLNLRGMQHRVSLMMFIWIRFCSNILYYIYMCVCVCVCVEREQMEVKKVTFIILQEPQTEIMEFKT
jgi:hypothetical protein